jgi:type II secretory ATPase GspE/PulE/Tfp pilus assembly ATPase PilB-like protein
VLTVSAAVNKLILQHSSAETIEAQAVADGMLTMRQDGYLKALSGYTTLEEVIRLTDVK